MSDDPRILTVRPKEGEYAWTFGGAPPRGPHHARDRARPVHRGLLRRPGAFRAAIWSPASASSPSSIRRPAPSTSRAPSPGDTLAVHFVSIRPARDWAASTTVPLFGALTSTHTTATLQPPLPEVVWMWELDRARGTCLFRARESDIEVELPMDPMHGTVGVAPANLEVRSALVPDAHGGNMDTPEMRAGVTCYLGRQCGGRPVQPR